MGGQPDGVRFRVRIDRILAGVAQDIDWVNKQSYTRQCALEAEHACVAAKAEGKWLDLRNERSRVGIARVQQRGSKQ